MAGTDDSWVPIRLDSPLEASPKSIVPAPVLGAPLLPFELLPWEDFERLQWRVLRDVEGLRHARLYGTRGQAQHGLDIVALAPDEAGVALQSKRYEKFDVRDLDKAIQKYQDTTRPFKVQRLIIGVACEAKTTGVTVALIVHQENLKPLEVELWDKEELSARLRTQPEIVIQFFGEPTARAFCVPYEFAAIQVPGADAVAVREALARTPEESTGAADKLHAASTHADPARALELVEEAQALLRKAGFGAHAAQHEEHRSQLLSQLGRSGEAAREALEEIWTALGRGKTITAEITFRRLRQITSGTPEDDPARELTAAADTAIALHLNPLGHIPPIPSLAVGESVDRLRLAVLAGEIALANDRDDWLSTAAPALADLAAQPDTDLLLRTRLRLLVAEADGDWAGILTDARKLRLGHDAGALVSARYARFRALHQHFEEADALWEEAAGDASLARRWSDASKWVFSRRAFRTRWRITARDELLALEIALSEMGPSESIIRGDDQAYTSALRNLRTGELRAAAISAQRALRQAVAIADWPGEERARRVLGAILAASGEPERAAHHLARGTDASAMKDLAAEFPARYIDVTQTLGAPNYWTVGTAYRLLAAEADLIPDDAITGIAERMLEELRGAESGTMPDARGFATSRYLGTVKALAGIAERLTEPQASAVLAHFADQSPLGPGESRFHDEDEATTIARIAISQPSLQDQAVPHLAALLARSQGARTETTLRGLDVAPRTARSCLEAEAAAGNRWAQEMLAARNEGDAPADAVETARARITEPLQHHPGVHSTGTNAVGDAMLAGTLPAPQREDAVGELLRRAADPHVGRSDRGQYLLAASHLVQGIRAPARKKSFTEAMRLASTRVPSEHDDFQAQFTHKLGAMRTSPAPDSAQAKALYLAACLAHEDAERSAVKQQAYAMLGSGDPADYWPTRVLQQLGDTLHDDLGFLSGQGWAPRSLAAILWAAHPVPVHLGRKLAVDADPRVRRALATALATADPAAAHAEARRILSEDPAHSVRSILTPDG